VSDLAFLQTLEEVIAQRLEDASDGSYTARLAAGGIKKAAQKVGEEGVELALAAVGEDDRSRVVSEAADLLYHLLVVLKLRGIALADVVAELRRRHRS